MRSSFCIQNAGIPSFMRYLFMLIGIFRKEANDLY